MAEFNQDRAKQWEERYLEKFVGSFSPRIQKDLEQILPDRKWELSHPDELKSQYIWGTVGTGKTIYAVIQMLDYMRAVYACRLYRAESLFVSAPELLLHFRTSYGDSSREQEEKLVERYGNAGLLVLDDLGVEKTTEWAYSTLYLVINRRYETMLPTIYTCNLSLSELGTKFGDDRISSRIQQSCSVKHTTKNYRIR